MGVGQAAQHVLAHIAAPQRIAAHIGHQAPFHLHDRHARFGRDDANVRPAGDLQPAAQAHAVHRGDHRHRQLAPHHCHLLHDVGCAMGAPANFHARSAAGHAGHVQARTEGASLAGQHHGAHALLVHQALASGHNAFEHRAVERIHLVRPVQPDIGDMILDGDADAVVHGLSSLWSSVRRRPESR